MSVYTHLSSSELEQFFVRFNKGQLVDFKGTEDGVENTNYFLTNDRQEQFVLTIFETMSKEELPYYVELTSVLAEQKLPVPKPISDSQQQIIQELKNKPAVLFPRLPGKHIKQPTLEHCKAIGEFLGRMHSITQSQTIQPTNRTDSAWFYQHTQKVLPILSEEDKALLLGQIHLYEELQALDLPVGSIHADLFHDNALFDGEKVSGVIDFYNAYSDWLLLDLAVLINDWCLECEGRIDYVKANAVLEGYEKIRQRTAVEEAAWEQMLQFAACKFWVYRLRVKAANINDGTSRLEKNPDPFRDLILFYKHRRNQQ